MALPVEPPPGREAQGGELTHHVESCFVSDAEEISRTLTEATRGDVDSAERLVVAVYDELREIAARHLARERPDHTLQPTALAHEAYLRVIGPRDVPLADRAHFLAVAATAIRRILIDHARRRGAAKRGGDRDRIALGAHPAEAPDVLDLLALDEALSRLAEFDERKSRVVELRAFGGLPMEQIALILDVSLPTVERDWAAARAWLAVQLRDADDGS